MAKPWHTLLVAMGIQIFPLLALGQSPQDSVPRKLPDPPLSKNESADPKSQPPQPPAVSEAESKKPGESSVDEGSTCGACRSFDWSKSNYRVQKFFWPIGYATNLPTEPGYYSLRDEITCNKQEKPPTPGYARFFAQAQGFFDVDFSYVDKPGYHPTFLERMHRIHLGDDWMLGTGGEYRLRYDNENNSRLLGVRNDFELNRLRLFADLWYRDSFRVYLEYLNSMITDNDLAPSLTDRNYGDLLNAFVEIKLGEIACENVYARLGRQQILLGSQRIISPSDWSNTLRTFDGVRAFRRSEKWDVDLFWLQPVIPNPSRFDSIDNNQNFAGLYTTYRPEKDQILDMYYLYMNNNGTLADARTTGVGALQRTPYDYHTLGFRFAGKTNKFLSNLEKNEFLWDLENMVQMGSKGRNGSVAAGNSSTGIGYHFGETPWNPTFWMYYDYATGSNSVQGTNTYNQLYPLGHYYLGWLDYVGRANIQDLNFHMYLYPTKWITLNAQYHIFNLANSRDALYNTAAAVERVDPTGKAGRYVGSELDLIVNWHLGPHTDVVTAYSHMFAGDFLRATGPSNNLNTFWLIYNLRW